MSTSDLTPVLLARATERLRQERETFEQHRRHEDRWFSLRLVMGYSSVVLLASVMFVSSFILFNAGTFSQSVVTSAGAALFVDVVGLLVGVWKIALNPHFLARLQPVTAVDLQGIVDTPSTDAAIAGAPATAPANDV